MSRDPRLQRGKRRRGPASFTLVEMMLAIATFSILIALFFSILDGVNSTWVMVQSRMQSRQTGRAVLDSIASELRLAMLPTDLNSSTNLEFLENPGSLGTVGSSAYLHPTAIFWQAPVANDQTYGCVSEVGYFVQWYTNSGSSTPQAALCRLLVDPATGTSTNSNFNIYSTTSWLSTSLLGTYAPSPSSASYNYSGWVADNVVGLWARCLDQNGNPITLYASGSGITNTYGFDSRLGYETSTGLVKGGVPGNGNTTLSDLPHSVEVAIVVIDSPTAAHMARVPAYTLTNPTNFWSDIDTFMTNGLPAALNITLKSGQIPPGAQLYATRVTLQNAW